MLSPERLFEAKRDYGTILIQEINNTTYTIRLLCPEDYRLIIHPGSMEEEDIEEIVCRMCVLDPLPIDFDELDYGVSDLSKLIIQESGIVTSDILLSSMDRIRKEIATDTIDFIIANICANFPSYTPDDLEQKPVPKLLKLLAMAEKISGKEIITPALFKKAARGRPTMQHPTNPVDVPGQKFNTSHASEGQEAGMTRSSDALSDALGDKIRG
jgi:hypothetical protein